MRAVYIENFFFLSFTLHPPSRACVRVSTPVNGVKEGKKSRGHGSSCANGVPYPRGNSRATRLTYFSLSERRPGAPAPVPTRAPTLAHVADDGRTRGFVPESRRTRHGGPWAGTGGTQAKRAPRPGLERRAVIAWMRGSARRLS